MFSPATLRLILHFPHVTGTNVRVRFLVLPTTCAVYNSVQWMTEHDGKVSSTRGSSLTNFGREQL